MAKAPVPLTSLSEERRAEASARFEIVRPALEERLLWWKGWPSTHLNVQPLPFIANLPRLPKSKGGSPYTRVP